MADIKKTIEIVFGAVDNTGQGLSSVANGVQDFADGISGMTGPLSDLGDKVLKTEAAIVGLGAAMIGLAVNESIKFQNATLDLQKVLGDADGPIEKFTERARELSREYGAAAEDVLQSMANFKQAGFDAKEASELTKTALDLMIAGDIDASRGSDLLVASLKGFQLEASEAARVVDLLNAVSNEYATNLPELITGFALLSPVAKAAGLSIEETAGLLTPGIEVFRSGSEVANGLRTSLLRLTDDSKPVGEALSAIGVSQTTANGALRSARDIYFDVANAFKGMDNNQKLLIASQLVGIEQAAKFVATTEGLSKTLRIAGEDFDYAGSAAREVAVRLESAEIAVKRMGSAFNDAMRGVGDPLLDEFTGVANSLSSIFDAIGKSLENGAFGPIQSALEGVGKELAIFLDGIAKALPQALAGVNFKGLVDSFGDIGAAIGDIFGDIDLTKPEDLQKAIQFVVDSVESLNKVVEGIVIAWGPAIQTIIAAVNEFNGLSEQSKIAIGVTLGLAQIFESTVKPIIDVVTGAVEGLGNAMTALAGVMGDQLAVTTIPRLAYAFGTLLGVLGQAGLVGAAGAAGYAVGDTLVEPINKLVSAVTGSETTLGSWIYELLHADEAATGLGDAAADAAAGVKKIGDASAGAKDGTAELAKGLDGVEGAVSKVTDGPFVDYLDAMGNIVKRTTESGQSLEDWNEQLLKSGGVTDEAAKSTGGLAKASESVAASTAKIVPIFDAATGKIIGYEQNMTKAGNAANGLTKGQDEAAAAVAKTAKEMKEAEEKTRAWNLEMAKIKSAENIALIAQQTEIATTKIKANAEVMVAAFKSVSDSITSTNSLISDLYGKTSETDRFGFQNKQLLESADKRANELTKAQIEMLKSQANLMQAQADAARDGGNVLKIEANGLQPHMEAFMWELLRAIQLRVNADGLGLLLGTTS